jgi:hypothetical protein
MSYSFEVVRNAAGNWFAAPSASIPNNTRGNCWIAGPYLGEFVPGNWNVSMSVIAVSNASSHTGRFIYRIWTSPTGSGENSTLVTSSFISSSIVTVDSQTVPVVSTATISLPKINLKNEYVLIQTYWSIQTAGGNSNADNDFVLGTGSFIQTPSFVTSRCRLVTWGGRHSDT